MHIFYKTKIALFCLLVVAVCFTLSCSKSGKDGALPLGKQPDVYVAGAQNIGGKDVATLWKNGKAIKLGTGTTESFAFCVFVSGGDVYVAGGEKNGSGKQVAKLWVNGMATDYSDGTNDAAAYAVFVSGNDVYVGGSETISGSIRGKLWKNKKLSRMFPKNTLASVTNIYVQGADVYATGWSDVTAQYWINPGTKDEDNVFLPDLKYTNSLFVSGNDIYVTGRKGNIARYIKNDKIVDLTSGANSAECRSVFVSGEDVYAVGYEQDASGNSFVKLWTNGTATTLSNGLTYADAASVFVWNKKAYVAINAGEVAPCYVWGDGKLTKLAELGYVYSIFVVDRP